MCEEEALSASVPLDPVFCAGACVYVCVCVSPSVPLDPVQIIIFLLSLPAASCENTDVCVREYACACVCTNVCVCVCARARGGR